MNKEAISTTTAPGAVGPYSQGIRSGGLLFLSGQIALAPATGKLVGDDAAAQAEQACENVMALLRSQGLSAANVVKTTVFITDIAAFAAVNAVYAKYFTAPCPARSCVEVSRLPLGALVEIEAIAAL
ncbi:MAG: reactive intermediate/imine deaminase [Desulfovibrio sp.]|nr:reactive intermediate/imine deaminase [Desulfovibrio sp.]